MFAGTVIIINDVFIKGEFNLKFIWFVLRQSGHIIPRILEIKKFKLPDLSSPERVGTFFFIT